MTKREQETNDAKASQSDPIDQERRVALRKFGRYTAPAMLALLLAEKAVAQSGPTGPF